VDSSEKRSSILYPLSSISGELRTFLQERLQAYMVPSAFVVLEELPRTPNGKLDRRALPTSGLLRDEALPYTAPRTPTEELLAGIWSTLLGHSPIGVQDNFFTLGGDSLLAVRVVAATTQQGLPLTLQDLLSHQTIGELAPILAERPT